VSATPSQQPPVASASARVAVAEPASSTVTSAIATTVVKRNTAGTAGAVPQKKAPKPGGDTLYVRE